MALIPDGIVEEVRQSNDICGVISEYLRLDKKGRNFTGLCPFHNEKTPSFTVNPDKQMYYCFGCGAGGNVISFVMQIENLSFPEAVKFLAAKKGIDVPEHQDAEEGKKLKEREKAFALNTLVKDFFHYLLVNHEVAAGARQYLLKRGIDKATLEKFQLGYAPPGWDNLLKYLTKKRYQPEYLENQGLVLKKSRGVGYYDRFRNRVMFPIWDHKNNVIGFGGRVLDDSLPKYLNSPETSVFNKSTNLYGINFAVPTIRERDHVIIVEGYLDVITCHQFGIQNVVASLGTAMTKEQGKVLARYAHKVYIAYDADTAGVAATLRGLDILQDAGCRVKVVTVPDGKDPDELIRKKGPESFEILIREQSKTLIEYKMERAMEKFDSATIEGKIRIVSELIPSIIMIQSEIEREDQIRYISSNLGISTHSLWSELKKYQRKTRKNMGKWDKITLERDNTSEFKASPGAVLDSINKNNADKGSSARIKAEDSLIRLLLSYPQLYHRVQQELGVNFTEVPEYLIIIEYLQKVTDAGGEFEPASILNEVSEMDVKSRLSKLLVNSEPPGDPESLVTDFIRTIREDRIKRQRDDILKQLEEAEQANNIELRNQLLREFSKLI